jgi:23S rRNA (pseudouridine1915-N3)-methyltransferase
MAIRIISVGKKHDDWIEPGLRRYEKRLKKPLDVTWVLLPPSGLPGAQARRDESERILSRLSPTDYVVLLDETGKQLDSPALSTLLEKQFIQGNITFIIGGAYGVDQSVQARAQLVWSLSPLVFPHQLVRLILTEQLYRAQQITSGGSYHHE